MPVLRAAWVEWICKPTAPPDRVGRSELSSARRVSQELDRYVPVPRASAAPGRKVAEQDPLIRAIP